MGHVPGVGPTRAQGKVAVLGSPGLLSVPSAPRSRGGGGTSQFSTMFSEWNQRIELGPHRVGAEGWGGGHLSLVCGLWGADGVLLPPARGSVTDGGGRRPPGTRALPPQF